MKNHKEILENLKEIVKSEIKDCKVFEKEVNKELGKARTVKYNQQGTLLKHRRFNRDVEEKYMQVLEILNSIDYDIKL